MRRWEGVILSSSLANFCFRDRICPNLGLDSRGPTSGMFGRLGSLPASPLPLPRFVAKDIGCFFAVDTAKAT
jgi:hypothetical protein